MKSTLQSGMKVSWQMIAKGSNTTWYKAQSMRVTVGWSGVQLLSCYGNPSSTSFFSIQACHTSLQPSVKYVTATEVFNSKRSTRATTLSTSKWPSSSCTQVIALTFTTFGSSASDHLTLVCKRPVHMVTLNASSASLMLLRATAPVTASCFFEAVLTAALDLTEPSPLSLTAECLHLVKLVLVETETTDDGTLYNMGGGCGFSSLLELSSSRPLQVNKDICGSCILPGLLIDVLRYGAFEIAPAVCCKGCFDNTRHDCLHGSIMWKPPLLVGFCIFVLLEASVWTLWWHV